MDKVDVFIASSHRDIKFADEIMAHLKPLERQGLISIATDNKFQPGTDWDSQIKKRIKQADIILLLISADFLASSSFKNIEMELELALQKQQAGFILIIPIITRPVSWRGTLLDKLQALPTGGRAITMWSNPEAAYFDITQGIRKAVKELTHFSEIPVVGLAEEEEHLKVLENDLRRSHSFLRDYVEMQSISYIPAEKQNAQKSIEKRLDKTRQTLTEYMELANKLSVTVPEDIIQASARIEEISEDLRHIGNIT